MPPEYDIVGFGTGTMGLDLEFWEPEGLGTETYD
jgi:hypothetical protein